MDQRQADYGRVATVHPYGRVTVQDAYQGDDGRWKAARSRGFDATALPHVAEIPGVGAIVPLYRHAGKVFYGHAIDAETT